MTDVERLCVKISTQYRTPCISPKTGVRKRPHPTAIRPLMEALLTHGNEMKAQHLERIVFETPLPGSCARKNARSPIGRGSENGDEPVKLEFRSCFLGVEKAL
jgi:hypothetical protein